MHEALKEAIKELGEGGGGRIPKLYGKFWCPLFFGLETPTFLAKSDKKIPKGTYVGGSPVKDFLFIYFYQFFWWLPLP